jgi:hypothetical protein
MQLPPLLLSSELLLQQQLQCGLVVGVREIEPIQLLSAAAAAAVRRC